MASRDPTEAIRSSLVARDLQIRDLIDRVEDLEAAQRTLSEYAYLPQHVGEAPYEPDWQSLSGWVVTGTRLQDINGKIVLDPSTPKIQIAAGGYIESSNFVAGSAGFQINGGTAEFNDVTVRGTIYATAGEIGGWTISASSISKNNATLHSDGYLLLGTSNDIVRVDAGDATYRLWVGNATASSAPFRVSKSGGLYATAGTIAGWDISDQVLSKNNTYISSTGFISLGAGDDYARLDAADATYRLWIGKGAASLAPFRVSKSGEVWATNGHFTGEIDANSGHLGSLDVDGLITVGTGTPYIEIDGPNKRIETSNFASGLVGFRIDGDGDAEFNNVDVRGALHCAVFVKDLISAHAGTLLVTKSAGKLGADCLILTDNLVIEPAPGSPSAWLFDTGDIIRLKEEYATGIYQTWITVTQSTPTNTYTYTKNNGDTATYHKGTTTVDYGVSGDGGITMTADMSNAPYLNVFTHAGAPWTTMTEHLRLGNLNGTADYVADAYGIFIGDYSGNKWLSYDPTNSLRIRGDAIIDGTIAAMSLDNAFGSMLMASDGLLLLDFQTLEQSGSTWYVKGSRGELATLSGAIHQEPGRWVHTRGLVIEEANTNLVYNPSFEVNATDFWAKSANLDSFTRVAGGQLGGYCGKMDEASSTDGTQEYIYSDFIAVAASTPYTASASIIKVITAGTCVGRLRINWYTAGDVYICASNIDFAAGNIRSWTRYVNTATSPATAAKARILITGYGASVGAAYAIYVDGVQFEQSDHVTTYCDGDQGRGYSWSGTSHNSTSLRTATEVNLDNYTQLVSQNATWSVAVVFQVQYDHDDDWPGAGTNFILGMNGTTWEQYFGYNASTDKWIIRLPGNNDITVDVDAFSAGDQIQAIITYDYSANSYNLYIGGELVLTSTLSLTEQVIDELNLGSRYNATLQGGFTFTEFAVFDSVLTEAEVAALHALHRPIVDMGAMTKPGIYILDGQFDVRSSVTGNRIVMTADEIAGYDSSDVKQFYLQASDGKAYAGAGVVTLDSGGVKVTAPASYTTPNSYQFVSGATRVSGLDAQIPSGANWLRLKAEAIASRSSQIQIRADSPTGETAIVSLHADSVSAADASIRVSSSSSGTAYNAVTITDATLIFEEIPTSPAEPDADSQAMIYYKIGASSDYLIVRYREGATSRYKYLTLTGTSATWTHSTTEPT